MTEMQCRHARLREHLPPEWYHPRDQQQYLADRLANPPDLPKVHRESRSQKRWRLRRQNAIKNWQDMTDDDRQEVLNHYFGSSR